MPHFEGGCIHLASVNAVTPVPEPENIAMLLAGLCIVGAARRRIGQAAARRA